MKFLSGSVIFMSFAFALASCRLSGADVRVSNNFGICARLPAGVVHAPVDWGATDFEVTELFFGATRGTVYVGDFPDFPGFDPDQEFHETSGTVEYIGAADEMEISSYLYRVGQGSRSSIHVLVQIPEADIEFNGAWSQGAEKRVLRCS